MRRSSFWLVSISQRGETLLSSTRKQVKLSSQIENFGAHETYALVKLFNFQANITKSRWCHLTLTKVNDTAMLL